MSQLLQMILDLRNIRQQMLICDQTTPEGRAHLQTLREQSTELEARFQTALKAVQVFEGEVSE